MTVGLLSPPPVRCDIATTSPYRATVIISVYKDASALRLILDSLRRQSVAGFQVIVSEDGNSPEIRAVLAEARPESDSLVHLTQEDCGFRKNRALNRAASRAKSPYLIFLDGDCVPHRRLVENHLRRAESGVVLAGRRVELGPRFSRWLRGNPSRPRTLQNRLVYLLLAPLLHWDGIRHYEVGLLLPFLETMRRNRSQSLLGCNFSCWKQDLLRINGFNEAYCRPGGGEDTDIQWRLERIGVRFRSVRYLAPAYHLHHPVCWQPADENQRILQTTIERDEICCRNGMDQHSLLPGIRREGF